jgi:hypothetical protein
MTSYVPFADAHGPDGHIVRWSTWNGEHHDTVCIRWENEGFTINGTSSRERVEYVLRVSPSWQVRHFILFRDLEEPDLWLATDGAGRWGEMNGAHRTELDGCYDVQLACTPFTATLPIRRLPLLDGHTAELPVVKIDTDTLEVERVTLRYTRVDARRWRIAHPAAGLQAMFVEAEFDVDEHGVVLDQPDEFRRLPA